MAEPRKRRITKFALLVLAGVAIFVAAIKLLSKSGPSAVEMSHALRIGMTRAEVVAVMGECKMSLQRRPNETTLLYGRPGEDIFVNTFGLRLFLGKWFRPLDPGQFDVKDWAVRIRLDGNGRVNRIERGDDVEEAAPPTSEQGQNG